MNSKLNIEDIKFLIPDYITGSLNDIEKANVENALAQSAELREFCEEIKGTLEFVSNVKFEEPPAQYWNSLLPRIHERIELQQSRRFSWSSIGAIWKIVVPVAAVLLIFIVYQLLKSPENQISKDENRINKENVIKDTSKQLKNDTKEEIKQPVEQNEEKLANDEDNNSLQHKQVKKNRESNEDTAPNENVAQDNNMNKDNEIDINHDNEKEDFASIDPDDISIIAGNEQGAIDEETEKELNKLDNNEKDALIQDLLKSNL